MRISIGRVILIANLAQTASTRREVVADVVRTCPVVVAVLVCKEDLPLQETLGTNRTPYSSIVNTTRVEGQVGVVVTAPLTILMMQNQSMVATVRGVIYGTNRSN